MEKEWVKEVKQRGREPKQIAQPVPVPVQETHKEETQCRVTGMQGVLGCVMMDRAEIVMENEQVGDGDGEMGIEWEEEQEMGEWQDVADKELAREKRKEKAREERTGQSLPIQGIPAPSTLIPHLHNIAAEIHGIWDDFSCLNSPHMAIPPSSNKSTDNNNNNNTKGEEDVQMGVM